MALKKPDVCRSARWPFADGKPDSEAGRRKCSATQWKSTGCLEVASCSLMNSCKRAASAAADVNLPLYRSHFSDSSLCCLVGFTRSSLPGQCATRRAADHKHCEQAHSPRSMKKKSRKGPHQQAQQVPSRILDFTRTWLVFELGRTGSQISWHIDRVSHGKDKSILMRHHWDHGTAIQTWKDYIVYNGMDRFLSMWRPNETSIHRQAC